MSKFGSSGKSTISRDTSYAHLGFLRQSQLITTFGPGAVVDMPDYTVIVSNADNWYRGDLAEKHTLHEPNLERLCHVKSFREPPVQSGHGFLSRPRNIETYRFPLYHFCPECGLLQPYWNFRADPHHLVCQNGHPRAHLIPSRFVAACSQGHLEDFPYDWWVHHGKQTDCSHRGPLKISFSQDRSDLGGIRVTCTECGASETMANALGPGGLHQYKCRGKRPWIFHHENEDCECDVYGLLRTASNLYFPQTASTLTIPPWSTKIQQTLSKYWSAVEDLDIIGATEDQKVTLLLTKCREDVPGEHVSEEEIRDALRARQNEFGSGGKTTQGDQRLDEYLVLSGRPYEKEDDLHFHTEHCSPPPSLADLIENVVLAKRLREVLALRGFTRLGGRLEPVLNSPVAGHPSWLPAVEMRGEGIFIVLRERVVRDWEEHVQEHYAPLVQRLQMSEVRKMLTSPFSPRFVLLHTLAHLLIRQLAAESGYATAAIKERIYSSNVPDASMAGILLYTASSDADGSLGGLVRKGKARAFERTFHSMLDEAVWCSSDPVCSESMAQGFDSLNYAACHSCTLLPETSCEMRNCLLDRAAVLGTPENRDLGFFSVLVS